MVFVLRFIVAYLLLLVYTLPRRQFRLFAASLQDAGDNAGIIDLMADAMSANVTLSGRTLYKDGSWNTLCLPFDVSADQIAANANFGESLNDVDWKISVIAKNCRLRPSEFEDAFLSFYEWHSNTNELPLLAYFSDSFPHREDKKKKTIKAKIASLRNFG